MAKENRIYAKAGSLCSASGADYTLTGGTDRIAGDGEEISTDRTPTLTVNLLSNGDKVSVHKSADCSDTALAGIAQIGRGLNSEHACAVTTAGAVTCWGQGDVGQLGNDCSNSSCANSNLPVDVLDEDGGSGVLNIGTKNRYACGDVRCAFIDN